MSADTETAEPSAAPRWRPLSAIERRVLGVLIEKAKTTPENYPLSQNAIRTGGNQKNNRFPQMQLDDDAVAEALDNLRAAGAVSEIQGDGRVAKYRHLAYEWLGVDKVELAVMAELLLRGSQTVGELRGRAARMEPIKDLAELQPILDSLVMKGLVVRLTPAGRGSIVSHGLYLDQEMDKVRREASAMQALDDSADSTRPNDARSSARPSANEANASALSGELSQLRAELAALRTDFESTTSQLRHDVDELNRQLGN